MEVKHGALEFYDMRALSGVQLKDRRKTKDLMLMLGLNETIHQLVMANRV